MKKFVLGFALVSAVNVATAATSTTSVVAPTAAATTVSVPAAQTAVSKPSKWSTTVYGSSVLGRVDAAAGVSATSQGDLYGQVSRDIGKGQSVSIRPTWLRNQTHANRKTEITHFDTYLLYTNRNYFGSTFRTNIPTGEWSREIGRHEIRYDAAADLLKAGKFTLTYAQAARRYFYTKDSEGQRTWRWENDLIGTYAFNDKVNVFLAPKYEANWRHAGVPVGFELRKAAANPENFIGSYYLELGAGITPVKGISIEPSIVHERDSRAKTAIDLFNDKETSYELEVSISI